MDATLLGLVAGALTSLAAVPQVVRTYRTKHARDLSIWQPLFLTVGMVLWLVYGLMIHDLPLIAANLFSLACYAVLIIMKIRYDRADVCTRASAIFRQRKENR
jgi:MtN3 and saliva related transmembrane protein